MANDSGTMKVTKLNKQSFLSNEVDPDLPALSIERRYLVALPHKDINKDQYKSFYEQVQIYHEKLSLSTAKKFMDSLIKRRLILLCVDPSSKAKNGILGTVLINDRKIAAVLVDTAECEIDIDTGEIGEIDTVYFGSYFNFLRGVTIINGRELLKDYEIHKYLINFLCNFFSRSFKSKTYFSDMQKAMLIICVTYFFYRFICFRTHQQTLELLSNTSEYKEYKDDIKDRVSNFKKYKNMKDIFNSFIDVNLVDSKTSSSSLMLTLLQMYRSPLVFYSVTTTFDYLVAFVIVSKYNPYFLKGVVIDTNARSI